MDRGRIFAWIDEGAAVAVVVACGGGDTEEDGVDWGIGEDNGWAETPFPEGSLQLEDVVLPLANNIIACICKLPNWQKIQTKFQSIETLAKEGDFASYTKCTNKKNLHDPHLIKRDVIIHMYKARIKESELCCWLMHTCSSTHLSWSATINPASRKITSNIHTNSISTQE